MLTLTYYKQPIDLSSFFSNSNVNVKIHNILKMLFSYNLLKLEAERKIKIKWEFKIKCYHQLIFVDFTIIYDAFYRKFYNNM